QFFCDYGLFIVGRDQERRRRQAGINRGFRALLPSKKEEEQRIACIDIQNDCNCEPEDNGENRIHHGWNRQVCKSKFAMRRPALVLSPRPSFWSGGSGLLACGRWLANGHSQRAVGRIAEADIQDVVFVDGHVAVEQGYPYRRLDELRVPTPAVPPGMF